MQVLSTKKLAPNQRELLLNSGISFVEYDAIEIHYLEYDMPSAVKNAIFTSQHGVQSILGKKHDITTCFCVGEKTKALLEEYGLHVVKSAKNSTELAHFIAKNYKNGVFHYFCGKQRRDELPDILLEAKISLLEVKTYETELKLKKFDQKWDGILFFSPSGVESFVIENNLANSIAFCIGETTANEAKKCTGNVIVANSTTVESVIAKAVKTLHKN